ncbi:hypothetical protein ACH5RR_005896 [Cinchona calisaya]|uniref:Uncharacterized protein n=1 Tax=Cinchona calisaya TaxID=153742 RepID=A0ABD3AMG2_9GENT
MDLPPITPFGGFISSALKLGVGGFSMGAAASSTPQLALLEENMKMETLLQSISVQLLDLSGWLPCAKSRTNKMNGLQTVLRPCPVNSVMAEKTMLFHLNLVRSLRSS